MIKITRNTPEGDIIYLHRDGELLCMILEDDRKQLIEDLKLIGKKSKKTFISSYNEYELLATSPRKSLRIIAQYAAEKKMVFYSKVQVADFVSRNIKAATVLEGLPGDKILRTINYLKNNVDFKWTLETVVKYAEDIDNLAPKEKKALGEFIV
jgi:hypothetical protein